MEQRSIEHGERSTHRASLWLAVCRVVPTLFASLLLACGRVGRVEDGEELDVLF